MLKMKVNKEIEFNNIVNDILKNKNFIELKYEIHHGISRLEHSINVAKLAFLFCRKFHVKKCVEVTRAALLHDFFKSSEVPTNSFINHPLKAAENAGEYFAINGFQKNIIESHMFPMTKVMPKYKECWIVSGADKAVAMVECARYKIPLTIGATFLFFINFIFIQR